MCNAHDLTANGRVLVTFQENRFDVAADIENHEGGSGDHLLYLGAGLRQLTRLTGFSFGVIQKL